MILLLDTTDPARVHFGLSADEKRVSARETHVAPAQAKGSPFPRLDVSALLFVFLKQQGAEKLNGVIVRERAGTFSGVRLGVTVTNSFVLAQNIPAVAVAVPARTPSLAALLTKGAPLLATQKPGVYLVPHYDRPPNISVPKARRKAR
jgi:tRNA A37 threonylcarbamoyladenosine modification protein TsaB